MNQANFEQWSEMAKKMQEPFKALAELNVQTLQNLNFLKPDELSKLQKPEEIVEKQINLAIENGHKALDYLQKAFKIFENAMRNTIRTNSVKE